MKLYVLFTALLTFTTSGGQEIVSTGQHSSEEFLWAVAVDNLSFNISFSIECPSKCPYSTHNWKHVVDDETLASFRTDLLSNGKADCYNGSNFNNPPHALLYGINYSIACSFIDSVLQSQFSIISPLNSSYNGSEVMVEWNSVTRTEDLHLKYCVDLEEQHPEEHLEISGGTDAEYGNVANYTCSDSVLVVGGSYDRNIEIYSRKCNYDAKWTKQGVEVECWFAPETNVSIEQNGVISNGILVSEVDCTIICTMSTAGYPNQTDVRYYKNRVPLENGSFYVKSDANGANVSCQMVNSYVNEVDSSSGLSRSITLDVLYQPEPINDDLNDVQSANIDQNYNITIKFNANPWLQVSNTTMYFAGQVLNSSNAKIYYDGTLHTYKYQLVRVTDESFGIYTLSTESPATLLAGRVTNFTVNLSMVLISTTSMPEPTKVVSLTTATTDDSALSKDGLEPGIIAVIAVVGIVVLILLVVAGIWFNKRRSSKSNSPTREERDNPLYGTTTTNRNEEYATVHKQNKKKEKEEKVNPLYQSTQETNGATIEPAYGRVGQEKDSNEPGTSDSTMNPNTSEVTYAAVNKPKKNKKSGNSDPTVNQDNAEVTYSVVNKRMKIDKAGTSDSNVDPNTSEVTYAAVKKPKKNK